MYTGRFAEMQCMCEVRMRSAYRVHLTKKQTKKSEFKGLLRGSSFGFVVFTGLHGSDTDAVKCNREQRQGTHWYQLYVSQLLCRLCQLVSLLHCDRLLAYPDSPHP